MKGDTGTRVVLLLIIASLAAVFGIGMFSGQSENLTDLTNTTANETSNQVDNASCQRKCIQDHPSKGSGYYTCLDNNGCS